MSNADETERELEEWLEEQARSMPQYVLESSLEAVARTPQVSRGGPLGIPWLNRRRISQGAAVAVVLVAIAIGPGLIDRLGRGVPGGVGAPACAVPPPDLAGWWPGDGNVDDIAGGREAELFGGATFAPGLVGESFRFDGADDFADVADDPALDVGRGDFSLSLWVWFDEIAGEQVLAEKWVQRYEEPAVGWTVTKLETNALGFFTEDGIGGANGVDTGSLELPARSWLHVVARRIGGTVDLFMNGERVASASNPSAILDLDSEASLKFGHRGGPDDTPGSEDQNGYFLDGMVDEVEFVVGRAITDDEVSALYRAGRAGSCKP